VFDDDDDDDDDDITPVIFSTLASNTSYVQLSELEGTNCDWRQSLQVIIDLPQRKFHKKTFSVLYM
jgi:hypothetical protein